MHDLRKVIAWMSGALVSFSALAVAVRELAGSLSVFEILALRNLGGIVILAVYALAARQRIGAPRPLRIHLLRNVFHFGGQACWAFGVTILPLATVFALEFTTPAWTLVLAVLFLRERLSTARIGAVVLGFIGVLVILRPGAGSFRPEALVVLLAAMLFAVQLTTTKFLTGRNSVLTIMFWMNVMQLPMYLLADLAAGNSLWIVPRLHAQALPAIAALCVSGLLAHVCVTSAFRHGDAVAVVPIDFLRIPLIAMVGVAFYGEAFDPLVLLGAAISAGGIIWSLRDRPAPRAASAVR
ncbi:DMT family transporter [Limobrevibacterium gyesilva]|uniref:DMT family transporter n=1 Tax=Limobrevibacterium gyesilva TaxID=2991712 RepID=A0AA41YSK4_9PROT|nr:DMT family transporter [Limobrevibacterium gyesilva]MCW3477553.1 DMT family transporter [Limobrevibacterium gyesilva]